MIKLFNLLLETIIESLPANYRNLEYPNPRYTGPGSGFKQYIKLGYGLSFPDNHPVKIAAVQFLKQLVHAQASQNPESQSSQLQQPQSTQSSSDDKDADNKSKSSRRKKFDALTPAQLGRLEELPVWNFSPRSDFDFDFVWSDPDSIAKLNEQLEAFGYDPDTMNADVFGNLLLKATEMFEDSYIEIINIELGITGEFDDEPVPTSIEVFGTRGRFKFSLDFRGEDGDATANGLSMDVLVANEKGKDLSGKMLQTMLDIGDNFYITYPTFEAAMTSGGFVWARAGGLLGNPYEGVEDDWRTNDLHEHLELNLVPYLESLIEQYRDGEFVDYDPEDGGLLDVLLEKIEQMETDGTTDAVMEVLSDASSLSEPECLRIIANSPFGAYLLAGSRWNGYFHITPGSVNREIIEAYINRKKEAT